MSSVSTPSVLNPAPARQMPVLLSLAILAAIIGVLFVVQLRHFAPFMTDDAYISLRYSQRLLEGHGLTWNNMRPVEGYTNLLWVLLCAGLGALGIPLPLAAHLLGIATTLAILVAVVVYIYRNYPQRLRFFSSLIACSALVLSSPFSMWSLGGLEQPLLAGMLVWAAFLMLGWLEQPQSSISINPTLGIGFLLGLACLSRADAAMFTAAFFTAAVIADGVSVRSILYRARVLPIPILFFIGQLIFRKTYYHEWVPNTAFVKVAFTGHRLYTGLRYACYATKVDSVFLLLVAAGAYALWRAGRQKQVKFLITIGVAWTAYLILIGGDIFPAYRHFEPVIALFGFLVAGCGLLAVDSAGVWKRGAIAGLIAATALVATSDAMSDQEHWEPQGESLGLFLNQAFGAQQPLLSSDAAGVVPFFAHIPVLDPLGLNDYHIAHEASRSRGHGWVGHELGDGKYILDQKPDLLLFSSFDGTGELFPADRQILADPRFAKDYQEVRFDTPEPNSIRALMYIRRIDGKLGVQDEDVKIVIPAYVEKTDLANSIHLVNGKATLVVAPGREATYEQIPVPAGQWRITIDSDNAQALALQVSGGSTPVASCNGCAQGVSFTLPTSRDVEIAISNNQNEPLTVQTITLTRKP
jgi:arabinofuranosyltransferase